MFYRMYYQHIANQSTYKNIQIDGLAQYNSRKIITSQNQKYNLYKYSMKPSVYLIGAGGHSKQVIDVFELNKIKILGIFDDQKIGTHYKNYKISGKISDIPNKINITDNLFCTIGNNYTRKQICEKYYNYTFINCIHPLSFISDTVKMGKGNYIGSFTNILGDCEIGNFNVLNDSSTLPHDVKIGNYNHLAIGCSLGGWVNITNNVLIGVNATILPKITVNDDVIVGAGSVIVKDIPEKSTVVGNPGKIIKK